MILVILQQSRDVIFTNRARPSDRIQRSRCQGWIHKNFLFSVLITRLLESRSIDGSRSVINRPIFARCNLLSNSIPAICEQRTFYCCQIYSNYPPKIFLCQIQIYQTNLTDLLASVYNCQNTSPIQFIFSAKQPLRFGWPIDLAYDGRNYNSDI